MFPNSVATIVSLQSNIPTEQCISITMAEKMRAMTSHHDSRGDDDDNDNEGAPSNEVCWEYSVDYCNAAKLEVKRPPPPESGVDPFSNNDVIHCGGSSLVCGAATTTTTNNDAAATELLPSDEEASMPAMTTATTTTAMWEEPAPMSDNAAAMEAEWPATAINSFGYDGDNGGLPATSGSNVFSSL
jgi:hypothetical protein